MKITLFLISLLAAAAYSSSAWVQTLPTGPQLVETRETTTNTYPDGFTTTATTKTNPDGSTTTTVTNPYGNPFKKTTKENSDGSTTTTNTFSSGITDTFTTRTETDLPGTTFTSVLGPSGYTHLYATTTNTAPDGSTTTTKTAPNGFTATTKTNADGSTTTTETNADGYTSTYTSTTTTVQIFSDGSSVVKQPDGKIVFYGSGEGPYAQSPFDLPSQGDIIKPTISLVDDLKDFDSFNLNLSIDRADNKTVGTPNPSEETQKVEEKKSSWWESLIPALIPSIGVGVGRDRESDRPREIEIPAKK